MAEKGPGFARILVAVVQEEDNFTADFLLQPAGGEDFCRQKPFGKESARLLTKTDDRRLAHTTCEARVPDRQQRRRAERSREKWGVLESGHCCGSQSRAPKNGRVGRVAPRAPSFANEDVRFNRTARTE